jgi:hypothetical protein
MQNLRHSRAGTTIAPPSHPAPAAYQRQNAGAELRRTNNEIVGHQPGAVTYGARDNSSGIGSMVVNA